jgi:hypothetical protein
VIQNGASYNFTNSVSPAMAECLSGSSALFVVEQTKSAPAPQMTISSFYEYMGHNALQISQSVQRFYITLQNHQRWEIAGNPEL